MASEDPKRSTPRNLLHSEVTICCAHCQIPLLIDTKDRETVNSSRASATLKSDRLCKECRQEKSHSARSPASRLVKSASINWSNMGNKIETWFEKAQTPDQRVVYNFLQNLNNEENKSNEKPAATTDAKDLNDVLSGLKKYETRFNSPRRRQTFSRAFESSSWRVLRHPTASYQFTRYNSAYGNEATRDMCVGSILAPTNRKVGSTFLLHPDWV